MSEPEVAVTLRVNGQEYRERVPAQQVLADYLTERRACTVRVACDQGVCGACTVLVDGEAVASCATFVFQVDGCEIVTIDGIGDAAHLHPVQRAFLERHALQCGFCTPGMVLTAVALLERHPDPTPTEVREWMNGNVCRCTGYLPIGDAVLDAARHLQAESRP